MVRSKIFVALVLLVVIDHVAILNQVKSMEVGNFNPS